MLDTVAQNFTTEEIAILREWLKSKGSVLFQKAVMARVHEEQIRATKELSTDHVRRVDDAHLIIELSSKYRHALEVMKEFSDIKTTPYNIKIQEE